MLAQMVFNTIDAQDTWEVVK